MYIYVNFWIIGGVILLNSCEKFVENYSIFIITIDSKRLDVQSWQRMAVNIVLPCKICILCNLLLIALIVIKNIFEILEFHI